MLTVFEATLPVFGLVFCGWIAARRRMLSDEAVSGINAFVFWFALPAMLFRVVSAHPLTQFADLRYFLAYTSVALLVFFLSRRLSPLLRPGADASHRTGFALNATHGNIGYLGIPLLAQLGDPTRLPILVFAIMIDIFVVILLSILLFELDRNRRASALPAAVGGLVKSPIILGIAVGLVFSALEWTLPRVVDSFVQLLAAAAGPCALFAIGASLGGRAIRIDREVNGLLAVKLIAHPLLMAASAWVFGVDPIPAAVAILMASLPSASNSFILAQRYGVDTRALSASIIVGTFYGAFTVTLVIWWLGLLASP